MSLLTILTFYLVSILFGMIFATIATKGEKDIK